MWGMPDQRKLIAEELDDLVQSGDELRLSEILRLTPEEDRSEGADYLVEQLLVERDEEISRRAARDRAAALFEYVHNRDFADAYHVGIRRRYGWSSSCYQTATEFRELYLPKKPPKELERRFYSISDYLQGVVVRNPGGSEMFNFSSVALAKFKEQVSILVSARDRLGRLLADIAGTLEATLLDDELEAAEALLKAKHLRSAGIVAGVVLERHLKSVVATHQLSLGRNKAQIANLNNALKEAGVIDVPRWRAIQRLGDLRNLCGHDGEREPTTDDVREMIDGTQKIVADVF
jgi:hypothetical protein